MRFRGISSGDSSLQSGGVSQCGDLAVTQQATIRWSADQMLASAFFSLLADCERARPGLDPAKEVLGKCEMQVG